MIHAELRSRTARGASFALTGQVVILAVSIGSMVVLSRLLKPYEFGMYAVLQSVAAFVDIFRDMGLSAATVHRQTVRDEELDTLFWLAQCVGLVLAVVMAAVAPVVARAFSEPTLGPAAAAISVVFVLGALAGQHQALLRRQMRVGPLMLIDIVAKVFGVAVAIASAIAGLGLWSLVLMQIATVAAVTLGAWLACDWRPALPPQIAISSITPMLSFGGGLTLSGFLNYLLRNADNLIVGRALGTEALGYYSRAYSLLLLPLGQITGPLTVVAVPTLSRLQDDPARYRRYYLAMLKLVAHTSMPLVACMGALAHEIVWLVLGPQWSDSASIFQILAFAAFWTPVGATTGWIYMSLGQTHRMAVWTAIMTPITILAFGIGTVWGVLGVAVAYSVVSCSQILPQFWFALRQAPLELSEILRAWSCSLMTSILIILGVGAARYACGAASPLAIVVSGLICAATIWTISLAADTELRKFLWKAIGESRPALRHKVSVTLN